MEIEDENGWMVPSHDGYLEFPKQDDSGIAVSVWDHMITVQPHCHDIDANQDCLEAVKEGSVACTIFQNAMGQAKWSAASAYAANVAGETTTESVAIPFETVDASNVDDYLS